MGARNLRGQSAVANRKRGGSRIRVAQAVKPSGPGTRQGRRLLASAFAMAVLAVACAAPAAAAVAGLPRPGCLWCLTGCVRGAGTSSPPMESGCGCKAPAAVPPARR